MTLQDSLKSDRSEGGQEITSKDTSHSMERRSVRRSKELIWAM